MSIKSGFFNSNQGDRVYNSDDLSTIYEGILTDGVVKGISDELEVTAHTSGGMRVVVGNGKAIIADKWVKIVDTGIEVALEAANATYPRIDTIVARLDVASREIVIAAKTGVAESSPHARTCTYTASVKEIPLAHVAVSANTTTIVASNITDKRQYSAVQTGIKSAKHYQRSKAYTYYHASTSDIGRQVFAETAGTTDVWDVNLGDIHQIDVLIQFSTPLNIDGQYISVAVPLPNDLLFPDFAQVTIVGTQGNVPVSIYDVEYGHGDYTGKGGEGLSTCGYITLRRESAEAACQIRKIMVSFMYNAEHFQTNYSPIISF